MENKDSSSVEEGWPATRPPSVPGAIWNVVPESLRRDFIEAAALGLRRGIHPVETFGKMLKDQGIDTPTVAAPAPPPKMLALRPRAPVPPSPPQMAPSTKEVSDAVNVPPPARSLAPPPVRARTAVPALSPRTPLGKAIQAKTGPKEKFAADTEAAVLSAIAADPVSALWEPEGISRSGAISRTVGAAVSDEIMVEAQRAIDEMRQLAASGDSRARNWVDPDNWSFNLEVGPADTVQQRAR